MSKIILMFDIITQMVLHLLFYFLNVCDVKRKRTRTKSVMGVFGRNREVCSNTGMLSDHNEVENIEFSNVFPKSCLVNESEYLKHNESIA